MRICVHTNENGMVLVLAMFMMALLSMIGIASMMTSTTDIEIATGEQQYVETFYRAQASHTIAGEVLLVALWDRGLGSETTTDAEGNEVSTAYETIDPDGNPAFLEDIDDYTFAFRLTDPDVLQEPEDSVSKTTPAGRTLKVWEVDQQDVDELPCPSDMTASECSALNAKIGEEELDLWTDLRLVSRQGENEVVLADIDIDKVRSQTMAGGGAEFGSKDLGLGSQIGIITYNLDARARLSSGSFTKSPSRQALGFRVVK
jgi:hypothetical protein